MATLASTAKERINPLELLATLNRLAGQGAPNSQNLQTLAQAPNAQDAQAEGWQSAADAFKVENATPLTALIKGISAGIATDKRSKAQRIRDENVAQYQQKITEYEASMKERRAEIEDMLSAEVAVQKQARAFNDAAKAMKYGNGAPIAGLIQADDGMMRTVKRQVGLPAEANIDNVSMVKSQDGIEQVVVTGRLPDGSMVVGQEPIAFRKMIASIAPAYLDELTAQEAAEAEAAAKAQEQQLGLEKTRAQIDTERAQAGSYDALAAQRRSSVAGGTQTTVLPDGTEIQTPNPGKPLPVAALKEQGKLIEELGIANNIQADLDSFTQQIDSGDLNLSLFGNLINQGKNMAGLSTGESRNLASFKASLEKLRNDSLRLNNGVQTEGDAQRAWNELVANISDEALVRQRLQEIKTINERGAGLKQLQIDTLRQNFGAPPMDYSALEGRAAVGGAGSEGWSDADEARLRELEAKAGGR